MGFGFVSVTPAEMTRRWFPICGPEDLPPRHVLEAELLGQELAVWRASGGGIQVWANRCPHRGMRLTVGANMGETLRCAYHGYRFAHGSGQCTSVPAQPNRLPPRSLCVTTFPVVERHGLIWTRLQHDVEESSPVVSGERATTKLYSVVVQSTAMNVGAFLSDYRYRPSAALADPDTGAERCDTRMIDPYSFESVARKNDMTTSVWLFTQPVDAHTTAIHGTIAKEGSENPSLPALRHHAEQLERLRVEIELAGTRARML